MAEVLIEATERFSSWLISGITLRTGRCDCSNGSCGNNSMSDFSDSPQSAPALLRPVLAPHPPPAVIELLTADIRQHLTPVLTSAPPPINVTLCGLMPQACTTPCHLPAHNPRLPALLAPVHWAMLMSQTKENPLRLGIIVWLRSPER